jgi:PAS domain S-box-containing protein
MRATFGEQHTDRNILGLPTEPPGGLDMRFCEVMDAAPAMIWVSGQDKGCIWFNRLWRAFTGRSMAQEVGSGWTEGVDPGDFDACLKTYISHFDARIDFRMQYRLRRRDGVYRWIDDTGIPRFAHDGTFLGYIGSCLDIHEHRETQIELRRRLLEIAQLNRQAEAAALAASIAHEVNQPLAAMIASGNAGLRWLARKTPDVDRARASLSGIVGAGHRMSQLIDGIRAMFKKEHQVRTLISLNELIQEVLVISGSDLRLHHVTVRMTLDAGLPKVLVDRVQLQQVILNLIKNAIEAMDSVADSLRMLHLKTEVDDCQNLMIIVQDSGPGIDPKNLDRVFDRFFTTKSRGMGLGLSICRSIIEAHDGRLWAESGVHDGSAFRISLPTSSQSPVKAQRSRPSR